MYIDLDQGPVADTAKAVDLAGFDDQNITRAGFELLSVHNPETAAFSDELDFIVRMTMGARTTAGQSAEKEYGDIHVSVVGPTN
jgi:hypothetical protein